MDLKLFLLINGVWTNPALDRLMAVASSFAFWTPIIVVAVLVIAWRGGFRARSFLLVALLTAGIADGVVSGPLKRVVNRQRPADTIAGVRQLDLAAASPRVLAIFKKLKIRISRAPSPGASAKPGRSFPSSHTVNTIAVATVAAFVFGRQGMLAFLPALLVAWSRIYTGAHWPSDVAWSCLIGFLVGVGCVLGASKAWQRWGARLAPKLAAAHPRLLAVSVR